MKPTVSDYVAFAALAVSLFAIYQTREANTPRIVITPVAERSYVTCNEAIGEWETKSIVRFNVSNVGGRAATLERILPSKPSPILEVKTEVEARAAKSFSLVKFEKLAEMPGGSSTSRYDLSPIFETSKAVLVEGDTRDRVEQPLLNIAIEPGKAATLDFGITTPWYDNNERVESATLTLNAHFTHGEAIPLRTTVIMARPIIRGGRCIRAPK